MSLRGKMTEEGKEDCILAQALVVLLFLAENGMTRDCAQHIGPILNIHKAEVFFIRSWYRSSFPVFIHCFKVVVPRA